MNIVDGAIRHDTMTGMRYGELPTSLIMSKFEETDIDPGVDGDYNSYARTNLTNWGPDTNTFEHEEPRGAVNRNYGRLQLQYYGHRGDADEPYRPDYFDQFIGPEDRDPRGINGDPDFKQLVRQREARNRFTRFTSDASDHITGGGRSEFRAMQDNQTIYRRARDTLRVFDRQLDGRRDGMRREYDYVSAVSKQSNTATYGDMIADQALTPQKRATLMCNEIVRNSRKWRSATADAEFATPRYSILAKRANTAPGGADKAAAASGMQHQAGETMDSVKYKAAGILMADLTKRRRTYAQAANGDIDCGSTREGAARGKAAPEALNLAVILRELRTDADFGAAQAARVGKTGVPQPIVSQLQKTVYNHSAPAHHYLNAEVLYKTVKPGADLRVVQELVITDSAAPEIQDVIITEGKTAKRKMIAGSKLNVAYDTDRAESTATCSYRNLARQARSRVDKYDEDIGAGKSDGTQTRRPDHTNYRNPSANDVVSGGDYGENVYAERLAAPLGRKYLMRDIDRDARDGEMASLA